MSVNTDKQQIKTIADWLGFGSINLFGRPFAGKDTQAKRLADIFGGNVVGGGDIIRHSQHDHLKNIIDKGVLAPTDDYLNLIVPYLQQPDFARKPLILSSVGRWFGEQERVVEAVNEADHPMRAVVLLDLSEKDVDKRWQQTRNSADRGKREDDRHGILTTRLDEFRNKTQPVIDYYKDHHLLITVDGTLSPDDVTETIIEQLYRKATHT